MALIIDKVAFRARNIIRDKEGRLILINEARRENNLNVCTNNWQQNQIQML